MWYATYELQHVPQLTSAEKGWTNFIIFRAQTDNSLQFHLCKCTKDDNFLFVAQTKEQQHLLQLYGDTILVDATYKTTKYSLPLFLLVVWTNSGYIPAAEFIPEKRNGRWGSSGTDRPKRMEPSWSPCYCMIDYSEVEMKALGQVFPTTQTLLCSFHREQAWDRWCRNGKILLYLQKPLPIFYIEPQIKFVHKEKSPSTFTHSGFLIYHYLIWLWPIRIYS